MIKIDKTDQLYKYLTKLKVNDIDDLYIILAQNGRYLRKDVQAYFLSKFEPSPTNDLQEKDLEQIIDYYADIKHLKPISKAKLKALIVTYKNTNDKALKDLIINAKLKDVMHLCLNYYSLHKDVDVQDLLQLANISLMQALQNFDVSTKLDLDDYIVYSIWDMITKEFKEKN